MAKFKIGDKVQIKRSALLNPNEAFEMNAVGCMGGIIHQESADRYYIYRLLWDHVKYKAEIVDWSFSTGNYRVGITMPNGLQMSPYFEPKQLIKAGVKRGNRKTKRTRKNS